MAKEWNITNDGVNYNIIHKAGLSSHLIVNGEKRKLKSKSFWISLLDEEISLGSKTAHFVIIGNKIDLAVDDKYLGSGEPYVPLSQIPAYGNIMPIISIIWGFLFNGWMGIVIAILLSTLIVKTSLKASMTPQGELPDKSIFVKCLLLTVVSMVVTACFGIFLSTILYS